MMRRAIARSHDRALSLPEIVITIAIIGLLAAIAIPLMGRVVAGSERTVATRNLDLINGAVLAFNQSNWELVLTAAADTTDELAIYNSLRYRDPSNPSPGSPYLPENTVFVASSSADTYRARWNGRVFELLPPGTAGSGWDLGRLQGDLQAPNTSITPIPAQ